MGHPGGSLQSGGDLVGMVAVIVVHGYTVLFAHILKAALGIGKSAQRSGNGFRSGAEGAGYGVSSQGVDHIVGAGHLQPDRNNIFSMLHQIKGGAALFVIG